MIYRHTLDMSTIPDNVLYAEVGRRRAMAREYKIEPVSDPELAAKREKKREQMRKYRAKTNPSRK
jgi:hypothetical protein